MPASTVVFSVNPTTVNGSPDTVRSVPTPMSSVASSATSPAASGARPSTISGAPSPPDSKPTSTTSSGAPPSATLDRVITTGDFVVASMASIAVAGITDTDVNGADTPSGNTH